ITKSLVKKHPRTIYGTATAAVILAAAVVIGNQYVKANTADYVEVYVNGEWVGNVSDSGIVDQWLETKSAELASPNLPVRYELDDSQIAYKPQRAFKPETADEAVLAKLGEKVDIYPVGVEIIVNGEVVGVVRDKETANK